MGGEVPWGNAQLPVGDTASNLVVPSDTGYNAPMQEPWRNLLSLPVDDDNDDEEGGRRAWGRS